MLLFLGIALIISVSAFINWKRTVLIWLPLSMLFNKCACIRYASPALSVELAVNIALLGLYIIKERKNKQLCNSPFIFKRSFKLYLISFLLSMLFSVVPLSIVLTGTIRYFINTFIIVYLFQNALNTYNDINTFIKAAMIVFVPIIALALYESVFHDNPWLDYLYFTANDVDLVAGKMYYVPPFLSSSGDMNMRFGLVRCFSFFGIPIEFGCASVLYLFLFLYLNKTRYYSGKFLSTPTYICVSILCFAGVLLSNSKTPMLGLPFLFLAALPLRQLTSGKGLIGLALVIVVVLIIISFNGAILNNFIALFDSNVMKEGGGSSSEMRVDQYKVGWELFMRNPIVGNGVDSLTYMLKKSSKFEGILGAESSWLRIIAERGLVGIFAYLVLYMDIYEYLKKSTGKHLALFYCIGLMLMETATGIITFSVFAISVIVVTRIEYHRSFSSVRYWRLGLTNFKIIWVYLLWKYMRSTKSGRILVGNSNGKYNRQ